ncbi:MAG TPA: PAS domain S-box protein, partial [Mizugakiibacter sp.]|nr:PAS domain S-box protein [Mizugakiibacter sp.]
RGRSKADEIDLVVDELNLMRQGLRESFTSLKKSEAHARNILNSTAESIYGIDLEGDCTFCNPSGVRMLGYNNEEELLGRNMHELIHHTYPDGSPYPAREYLIYKAFLYGERAHSDTEVLWRKDGSCFPAEYWSYPIWSGGELAGSVVTFLDITKRKENEHELRKAHDELEQRVAKRTSALTEEIHERRTIELELLDRTELQQLIYTITATANKTKDTDAALAACLKDICDYTTWPVGHIYAASPSDPDKFIPTDIWHMEHPEWFSVFHDITMKTVYEKGVGMVGRVMASGKPEWIEDLTKSPDFIRAIPGVDIVARAGFAFPIKVGNRVVAVMEFFSPFDQKADQSLLQSIEQIGTQLGRLHERAEAEVTLLDEKEKAETANKAKSDFLSSMSHELRTPLNAIIGFSSTMKEETFGPIGNDKYREYLDDIHHSGQHLLKLINDILDVSAIEAGALELHEENVSLANVANSSINLVKPRADDGGVSVTASIDPQIPLIYVDERRLKQIMLNLLSNAVKFTPKGGKSP